LWLVEDGGADFLTVLRFFELDPASALYGIL
jgi:hypothetical protein